MVGQDNRQNPKPLVSLKQKKKVWPTEGYSLIIVLMHPPYPHNYLILISDIPFARSKFRRSCAILGACSDIPDAQGSQRILLFSFVCQGCGAQVKNQVQAVQKAPGSKQLEVLIMLKNSTLEKNILFNRFRQYSSP